MCRPGRARDPARRSVEAPPSDEVRRAARFVLSSVTKNAMLPEHAAPLPTECLDTSPPHASFAASSSPSCAGTGRGRRRGASPACGPDGHRRRPRRSAVDDSADGLLPTSSISSCWSPRPPGHAGELKESITRPDLIRQIIDAYGEALPNLQRHAAGWPAAESLHARVISGNHFRGREHIGAGHDTAASRALIERIDAGTPERPLNITIWGGQTDLAQALWRVKLDRGTAGFADIRAQVPCLRHRGSGRHRGLDAR